MKYLIQSNMPLALLLDDDLSLRREEIQKKM